MKKFFYIILFVLLFHLTATNVLAIGTNEIRIIENEKYTKTAIIKTEDKSTFTIDVKNCGYGNTVILALYDNYKLCDISIQQYIGKTLEYSSKL